MAGGTYADDIVQLGRDRLDPAALIEIEIVVTAGGYDQGALPGGEVHRLLERIGQRPLVGIVEVEQRTQAHADHVDLEVPGVHDAREHVGEAPGAGLIEHFDGADPGRGGYRRDSDPVVEMIEEVYVPWKFRSLMNGSLSTKDVLTATWTLPFKSWCLGSTPVSRTHTSTPLPAGVSLQARGALIRRMFH